MTSLNTGLHRSLFAGGKVGQVVVTDNRIAAIVIGFSSIVISVFGTLLVIVYSSLIPALIVHMSFAGFYSSASWAQP